MRYKFSRESRSKQNQYAEAGNDPAACVFIKASYDDTQIVTRSLFMDTPGTDTIQIEKADLFFALARIHQLIEDIDCDDDIDTTVDGVELAGITEFDDEGDDEDDPPDDAPCHFQNFLINRDESLSEYQTMMLDEYIGLFDLLALPLVADPVLKKEFQEYALTKHGVEIEFSTYDKKPKLTIVSSKKEETPPPPEKPPAA
jgi:hypothetical protein